MGTMSGSPGGSLATVWSWVDVLRRSQGVWLDRQGFGPIETPWQEAARVDGMRLRFYPGTRTGSPLLIVPAPIKRCYIWDLAPERSVVRRALEAGFAVGLVDWLEPAHNELGLTDYADRLPAIALAALLRRCRADAAILAGHSLGGTLAAIFASLHPELVRGLILVETPLRFRGTGDPVAAALGNSPWIADIMESGIGEVVPGSLLTLLAAMTDPVEFIVGPALDLLTCAGSGDALGAHLRVRRWTLDEFAMTGRLFAEVGTRLYEEDSFQAGTLDLAGRTAAVARLTMPMLAILDPDSTLVPAAAALAVAHGGGRLPAVRWCRPEPGIVVRHIGPLIGGNAHKTLWPAAFRWAAATYRPSAYRASRAAVSNS